MWERLPVIALEDPLPDTNVYVLDEKERAIPRRFSEVCGESLIVLFGLPGSFTPTCSRQHLPGFLDARAELRQSGVEALACLAVNDAYVMEAWYRQVLAQSQKKREGELGLVMLADGNAETTRALGLQKDFSVSGMGVRCRRFAALLERGRVVWLDVEEDDRLCSLSSAKAVLEAIKTRNQDVIETR